MYDLIIAIINKCFEFQNDRLKAICVGYNCTKFCPVLLCQRNHKIQTTSELNEQYATKAYQPKIISKCN